MNTVFVFVDDSFRSKVVKSEPRRADVLSEEMLSHLWGLCVLAVLCYVCMCCVHLCMHLFKFCTYLCLFFIHTLNPFL